MKKYLQNIWIRLIACILCTISVLGMGISILGTIFFTEYPDKQELITLGNERLMQNYALYAVNHLQNLDKNDFFAETNLYLSIERIDYPDGEEGEAVITNSYSNMPEGIKPEYETSIYDGTYNYYYNVESWTKALGSYFVYPENMVSVPIESYVFDPSCGIFYYGTPAGYFKVEYLDVYQGEVYYDYCLRIKENSAVYYNSYYQKKLDTSAYKDWAWVRIDGKMMSLSASQEANTVWIVQGEDFAEQEKNAPNYYVENFHVYYSSEKVPTYHISTALKESMDKNDFFMEFAVAMESLYGYQKFLGPIFCVAFLGLVAGIVLLAVSAPEERERLCFFHRIPILIFTGMTAAVEIGIGALVVAFIWIFQDKNGWNMEILDFAIQIVNLVGVMLFIGFGYLANVMTRIKTKVFFRYSEFYLLSRPVVYARNMIRENISLCGKGILVLGGLSLLEFVVLCYCQHNMGLVFGLFALWKLIEIPVCLFLLLQAEKLREGLRRVADGDWKSQLNTTRLYGVFKEHAEDINRISDAVAIAVEDQMKSERFKTELITNVSHDIKTPLTSIINYVDLIKKEEIANETILEYVDVLDRQSTRLKKLIEDLMEASKASTGNLEVNWEECDMGVLLTQVVGEFEDKLMARGLEPIVTKPKETVLVLADGRHIWRVLDNLMNNVCKYSQENTRVYLSLEVVEQKVGIVFRNISKAALNIPSEQLLQRFVRGDSSRHTEGSGLGLSIAQSLTELMGGTMQLDIDGDLFKVRLEFPVAVTEVKASDER